MNTKKKLVPFLFTRLRCIQFTNYKRVWIITSLFFLININITPLIIFALSDKPNDIEDRNRIIEPGLTAEYDIGEAFDSGRDIRVQVTIDTFHSNGILAFNLSNNNILIKKGTIKDKVDFIFTYSYEGGGCLIFLKNIGNVSLNYDLYIQSDASKTFETCGILFILIAVIAGVTIYIYFKFFRKKRKK